MYGYDMDYDYYKERTETEWCEQCGEEHPVDEMVEVPKVGYFCDWEEAYDYLKEEPGDLWDYIYEAIPAYLGDAVEEILGIRIDAPQTDDKIEFYAQILYDIFHEKKTVKKSLKDDMVIALREFVDEDPMHFVDYICRRNEK